MGLFTPKKPMTDDEMKRRMRDLDVELGKMDEAGLQHSHPKRAFAQRERMQLEADLEARRQKMK